MPTSTRGRDRFAIVTVAVPINRLNVPVGLASAMPVQAALLVPTGSVPVASPATRTCASEKSPLNAVPATSPTSGPSPSAGDAKPCLPQTPQFVTSGVTASAEQAQAFSGDWGLIRLD